MSLMGCHLVHYVPKDKLLLRDEVALKGNKNVNLETAVRMQPNRRVIWPKFYLALYNTGTTIQRDSSALKKWFIENPGRAKFYQENVKWLREEIGEAPVMVNKKDILRDSLNVINAYASNGFFDTKVNYEIDTIDNYFERRRGKVIFNIEEGKPFHIRKVWIKAPFVELEQHYLNTLKKSNIQVGERFSYNKLALERSRFANLLKTQGFFTFSPNTIRFKVDTFLNPAKYPLPDSIRGISEVDTNSIKGVKWLDVVMELTESPERYFISEVVVDLTSQDSLSSEEVENSPHIIHLRASRLTEEEREDFLITERKLSKKAKMTFLVNPELIRLVNYNFLAERIFFKEGGQYDRRDAVYTQQRLQDLSMFQYVLINYDVDENTKRIKIYIKANFSPKFEFKTGFEAYTNDLSTSFTLPIFGASISLRDKNTFRRSELMELSLGGNIGRYPINETEQNIFWQLQGKGSINFPRFILPFPKTWIPAKYREFSVLRPVTITSISGLRERREEYDRLSFTGNANYRWFNQPQSQREQTQLSPLSFEYIDYDLDPDFQKVVDSLPSAIKRGYQSRFNSWLSASYTVSDYQSSKRRPTYFSKISYEGGGNIPRLFEILSPVDKDYTDNRLIIRNGDSIGLSFGQYVKFWVEGKTQIPIKSGKFQLVLRGVMGGALPYGKTQLVPIERRFFAGGPSSMRGWQSNTLGPGSFPLTELLSDDEEDVSSLLAIGGEYLFELNAELRFHVWSYLDMAIFTDLGNVWLNPQKPGQATDPNNFNDPRAFLTFDNLYPGWDAGLGFRLDFDFLIVRIDLAQQLFDPGRVGDATYLNGWVLRNFPADIGSNSFQVHVGIGYPF